MQRVCCPSRKLLYNTIGLLAIPMKQNAKFDLISITFPAKIATFLFFFPAHWTLFFFADVYTCRVCVYCEVGQKKRIRSTSQMFCLKGWLLPSAPLTLVYGTNWAESKYVPPYGRSDYKAVQIFRGTVLQG